MIEGRTGRVPPRSQLEPRKPQAVELSNNAMVAFTTLGLLGRERAFVSCMELLQRVAPYGAPVLIQGETGTGKGLAAQALHYLGPRSGGPFVCMNCGAVPE